MEPFLSKNLSLRRPASAYQLSAAVALTILLAMSSVLTKEQEWVNMWELEKKWIKEYEPSFDTDSGQKDYDNIDEELFLPLGFKMTERSVIPRLDYIEPLNCPAVFENFVKEYRNYTIEPVSTIPWKMKGQFLLNGYVHLEKSFSDDRFTQRTEKIWQRDTILNYVTRSPALIDDHDMEGQALYHAMLEHSVERKRGMVVRGDSPWIAAIPLKLGASHMTVVENTKILVEDYPRISYLSPKNLALEYRNHAGRYDFIMSFSSLQHLGLGRFGKALDSFADIKEVQKVRCLLKKGGLFFVSVPIGWDILQWNLKRIYGRVRLAILMAGFDIVDMYYKDKKERAHVDWFGGGAGRHPVFVLRKR